MLENSSPAKSELSAQTIKRQQLMRCCTIATDAEMAAALRAFPSIGNVTAVRRPETGLVMMRGKIGGDGAPFNVGEATVTRAVVKLQGGEIGYSYLLGRSSDRAWNAAIIDALGQSPDRRAQLDEIFIGPVMARTAGEKTQKHIETEATRVDFFTLVRGDD
jgi:alpha-D-ribose 1-methylphosphonate 5-triphosphate synthase subunit PhnG